MVAGSCGARTKVSGMTLHSALRDGKSRLEQPVHVAQVQLVLDTGFITKLVAALDQTVGGRIFAAGIFFG